MTGADVHWCGFDSSLSRARDLSESAGIDEAYFRPSRAERLEDSSRGVERSDSPGQGVKLSHPPGGVPDLIARVPMWFSQCYG
jgi:hypothetical protein